MKRTVFLAFILGGLGTPAVLPAATTVPLAPEPAVNPAQPPSDIPDEALLLVRLLKAEASMRHGRRRQAERLLREIEPWIPQGHVLYPRLQQLLTAMGRIAPVEAVEDGGTVIMIGARDLAQPTPWAWFDPKRTWLALLPQSGPYGAAGRALLEQLRQQGGPQPVEVIDTALFNADELRELIEAYEPAWLLGPMRPAVGTALVEAGVRLPMLTLSSQCPAGHDRCVPLVPSLRETFLLQAQRVMAEGRTLLLADQDAWMTIPLLRREPLMAAAAKTVLINGDTLHDTLREALNIGASKARARWLEKQLGRPVVHDPRPRQDFDHIILYMQGEQAYQAASLLKFWGLEGRVEWFPSRLPTRRLFSRRLHAWPEITAWLPPFVFDPSTSDSDFGIFHAMGQSVSKVLTARPGQQLMLPVGWFESDAQGWRLALKPVTIHAGGFEPGQ